MRWVVGAWGPGLLRQWLSLHREGRAKADITALPQQMGSNHLEQRGHMEEGWG